jgi:hypothetical protein
MFFPEGITFCSSASPCALLQISVRESISVSSSSRFSTRRRSASRCQSGRSCDQVKISARTSTGYFPPVPQDKEDFNGKYIVVRAVLGKDCDFRPGPVLLPAI